MRFICSWDLAIILGMKTFFRLNFPYTSALTEVRLFFIFGFGFGFGVLLLDGDGFFVRFSWLKASFISSSSVSSSSYVYFKIRFKKLISD